VTPPVNRREVIEKVLKRMPAVFQIVEQSLIRDARAPEYWLTAEDFRVSHNHWNHKAAVSGISHADTGTT
jgi:hypothetical protein